MASHIIGHFVLSEPYEKLARSSDVVYFSMVAVWAKFQTLVIISKKVFRLEIYEKDKQNIFTA